MSCELCDLHRDLTSATRRRGDQNCLWLPLRRAPSQGVIQRDSTRHLQSETCGQTRCEHYEGPGRRLWHRHHQLGSLNSVLAEPSVGERCDRLPCLQLHSAPHSRHNSNRFEPRVEGKFRCGLLSTTEIPPRRKVDIGRIHSGVAAFDEYLAGCGLRHRNVDDLGRRGKVRGKQMYHHLAKRRRQGRRSGIPRDCIRSHPRHKATRSDAFPKLWIWRRDIRDKSPTTIPSVHHRECRARLGLISHELHRCIHHLLDGQQLATRLREERLGPSLADGLKLPLHKGGVRELRAECVDPNAVRLVEMREGLRVQNHRGFRGGVHGSLRHGKYSTSGGDVDHNAVGRGCFSGTHLAPHGVHREPRPLNDSVQIDIDHRFPIHALADTRVVEARMKIAKLADVPLERPLQILSVGHVGTDQPGDALRVRSGDQRAGLGDTIVGKVHHGDSRCSLPGEAHAQASADARARTGDQRRFTIHRHR
mmetsp:Transcript_3735/g.15130  ORF Transcript_3735/g.15130 Transcript_3735/m.15130 type:complete len:477 (+) Transcript_3735:2300-3730(+)